MKGKKMTEEKKKPVKVASWMDGFCEEETKARESVDSSLENMRYDDALKESLREKSYQRD